VAVELPVVIVRRQPFGVAIDPLQSAPALKQAPGRCAVLHGAQALTQTELITRGSRVIVAGLGHRISVTERLPADPAPGLGVGALLLEHALLKRETFTAKPFLGTRAAAGCGRADKGAADRRAGQRNGGCYGHSALH
jgi:hypothetical protein